MFRPQKQEVAKESPFSSFDDFESFQRTLETTMNRADELIAMDTGAMDGRQRQKHKVEVARVSSVLRQLLAAQMEHNGMLAGIDRADGSYDNAVVDNQLRLQLSRLRDKSIELNHMWGTRTVRKVSAWLTEDLPNWFGVKLSQTMDALKQLLKGTAVVGGLTAGGVIAGYAAANGGLMPGLSALGGHLSALGAYLGPKLTAAGGSIGKAAQSVSESLSSLWGRILGKAPPVK